MTVQTSVHKARFIGNGVNTTFPFSFKTFATTDLQLTQTSVAGVDSAVTSLFSIALNTDQEGSPGGIVTYPTSGTLLATGVALTVSSVLAETQLTDLTNAGGFFPKTITDRFDYLTILIQQATEKLSRAVLGAVSDVVPNFSLGTAQQRANKYPTFDGSGNVSLAQSLPSGTLSAASIGGFLYPAVGGETGVINQWYPVGHLLRYGADPTGVASSWNAFNKAVAVCKLTGSTLIVPAGNFLIDTVNGTVNLSYVTILGTGVTDGAANPAGAGSVFSITGTVNSPFTIGPGVTFDGIAFFYPAQVDSFTPIVFPPTMITSLAIAGAINFVYIQNCTVFNAYRFFVDTDATGSIGHVFIENNTIYGVLTCFEIAYNSEIITFTGNEFSPGHFLAATETGLRKFTRANGTVIQVPKTDGLTFNGNVLFGYLNGIAFNTSASLCQLSSITANYFDQVLFGIIATGTGNISGMTITANSFVSFNSQITTTIGNAIKITTSGVTTQEQVTIAANNFSICTGDEILVSGGAARQLTVSGNQFTAWGQFQASGSYGGINISGAGTSYLASNNTFANQAGTPSVANGILGAPVDAIINGNLFASCNTAINATFNAAVVTGNISFATVAAGSNNYPASGNVLDANNNWDKNTLKTPNWTPIASYGNYANDAAAATGGVPVGGTYRNASVVQVRVT